MAWPPWIFYHILRNALETFDHIIHGLYKFSINLIVRFASSGIYILPIKSIPIFKPGNGISGQKILDLLHPQHIPTRKMRESVLQRPFVKKNFLPPPLRKFINNFFELDPSFFQ